MTAKLSAPSICFLLLLTATTGACDSGTAETSTTADDGSATTSTTTGMGSETTDGDSVSDSTNSGEATTSTTGETSGSTSTGEAVCELPQGDVLDGSEVTITIENTADEPRFISPFSEAFCNYSQVEIHVDGEAILWDHAGAFPQSCTTCRSGCSDGGTDGLIINPGQTAEISWNGGYWGNTPLSESCGLEACEDSEVWVEGDWVPDECQVLRAMEDTAYTVRVNVFDTCPDAITQRDACSCDGDVCEVFYYEPRAGDYTVEANANFPAGVAIVLE